MFHGLFHSWGGVPQEPVIYIILLIWIRIWIPGSRSSILRWFSIICLAAACLSRAADRSWLVYFAVSLQTGWATGVVHALDVVAAAPVETVSDLAVVVHGLAEEGLSVVRHWAETKSGLPATSFLVCTQHKLRCGKWCGWSDSFEMIMMTTRTPSVLVT